MLDSETKRRIDTARDILVGKVPDPKSQVEQITIALIYKFMDDMDAESEELGGERKFFAGEFGKYGWAKLMRPGVGGHEMLRLYGEAIQRMPENPGIPPLFRNIFNNAYLPYRDPETLRAFLKTIDDFEYDHSERLGDAFEYLLSVLGSQGDAGQFRTPRHIIEFMVDIVDPKKNETVLDPACGTGGFLISAWKHILDANKDPQEESTLTPDERAALANNFIGYDISPDMVRLSLVNMYLHGFANPEIAEYDTLTSDEKWNEHADVILANPPFMSPKGGIRPHNRFGVQSKRSEVLFVDYIAEHLTPNGRAAIIVPEGIIFQSQKAYVQLRKMLVEEYLVAVVSLPAGVFNPYSGVKTSILFLDRALAKRSDAIGFFSVANDGYSLGAQRRPVAQNDLPIARMEILECLRDLISSEPHDFFLPTLGSLISKVAIAESGDFSLNEEHYRDGSAGTQRYPLVSLGDASLFKVESGGTPKSEVGEYWDGAIPWATLVDLPATDMITQLTSTKRTITDKGLQNSSAKLLPASSVLVSTRATIGRIAINREPVATNQGFKNVVILDRARALPEFVAFALTALVPTMKAWATGGTFSELSKARFSQLQIPLPPLDVHKEIVAEIDGYQKVIDGARAVVENSLPRIAIDPEWPMVELGTICTMGGTITSDVQHDLPYIGADSIESHTGRMSKLENAGSQNVRGPVYEFSGSRLLYSKIRPYLNKLALVEMTAYCSSDMYPLQLDESKVVPEFLKTYMLSDRFNNSIRGYYERTSIPKLNRSQLFQTSIPLPPLDVQRRLVGEIQAEQALVNVNHELIERFERKIEAALERIWGGGDVVEDAADEARPGLKIPGS